MQHWMIESHQTFSKQACKTIIDFTHLHMMFIIRCLHVMVVALG